MCPPLLLVFSCSRLYLPPLASSCVGGGASRVLGVAPHLLYQAGHKKGVRACSGGVPPSPLGWSVPSLLIPVPACRALGLHAARGVPLGRSWGSGVFPFPACRALGAHAARGVSLLLHLLPPGSGGSPSPSWACRALISHAAVGGGGPPFVRAWPARRRRARSVPFPLLPARGLCALLGLGGPFLVL